MKSSKSWPVISIRERKTVPFSARVSEETMKKLERLCKENQVKNDDGDYEPAPKVSVIESLIDWAHKGLKASKTTRKAA